MIAALKYRLRVAARNAGLIGIGALFLLIAVGFFTAAGWMLLAVAYGPLLATVLIGCLFAGLGLVFVGVALRDSPRHAPHPAEAKPKTTPLMEAFLVGLQAGTAARRR